MLLGDMPIKFTGNYFVMFYTKHLALEFIGIYIQKHQALRFIGKLHWLWIIYYTLEIFKIDLEKNKEKNCLKLDLNLGPTAC